MIFLDGWTFVLTVLFLHRNTGQNADQDERKDKETNFVKYNMFMASRIKIMVKIKITSEWNLWNECDVSNRFYGPRSCSKLKIEILN